MEHSRLCTTTLVLLAALSVAGAPAADGATYYVRPDGGSAGQCTGLADAPYPGSGTSQACAWDHPFRALPPGGTSRIAGGDTLVIGAGSYMMGLGAPETGNCDAGGAFDCYMAAVPSGPDPQHPTRILGAGWATGCANPPELWGTERAYRVLNLEDSSNVEVACLEITDHSGCVEFHSGALPCERDNVPYGPWADTGLYAEDSVNVRLTDIDIHGLAATGVRAGRLTDWTVERVRIAANGWVGWDGDLDGADSNSGALTFRHWTVEWNGCGETYPGAQPTGCWAQTAGGYGDGVGTGETTGTWVIEDSLFRYNTSDGLDLLYARDGSQIAIRRTLAEGNAGNQLKTNGPTVIENSVVVGDCGYFEGKPFTHDVDNCRAAGNILHLSLRPGNQATLYNNTVTGNGDCLVLAECWGTCNGGEQLVARNNILLGNPEFAGGGDLTCLTYGEDFPHGDAVFDVDYSLINGVKDDACPGAHDICGVAAALVHETLTGFDAHLLPGSPAIDAGTAVGAPATDFDGAARDAHPDIGAYEYGGGAGCSLSCTATVPTSGQVGVAVAFAASATATGCSGSPVFDWDFGDSSSHSAQQNPTHAYASPGTFTWTLTATADGQGCTRTGSITITTTQPPAYVYVVPAVAHAGGAAGTDWRTDLAAVNRSGVVATITMTFFPATDGASVSASRALAAGAAAEWRDAIVSLFSLTTNTKGTVLVGSTAPLTLVARTYNQETPTRTYGQYIPALTAASALGAGQAGVIAGLKKNAAARTNLGIVNLGSSSCTVSVRLFGASGSQLGSTVTLTAGAGRWVQRDDIFAAAGVSSAEIAYAVVDVITGGGKAWAYASVVDNGSGDPTTLPAIEE